MWLILLNTLGNVKVEHVALWDTVFLGRLLCCILNSHTLLSIHTVQLHVLQK